ncbi:inner centromere protein-like [Coccinella septempunctata]|uniref:inner centromere protein-like n=1 Tax=Coccinella septempunctata TaxID=41139 RepID=UPI001D08A817|nr:inner centromere protein-like [Coccinella septempunctata]
MEELTCDEFLESLIEEKFEYLEHNVFSFEKNCDVMLKEYEKFVKMLVRAQKTNNYGPISKYVETSSFKEILESNQQNSGSNVGKEHKSVNTVKVKKEKISISSDASVQSVRDDTENMPAPKMPAPKTKRVKKEKISNVTKIKVKQEIDSETENSEDTKRVTRSTTDRTSDVIIDNPEVPVIDLSDSFEKLEVAPVRNTRTKTKKKEEDMPIRSTRTRTKKTVDTKDDTEEASTSTRTTRTKTRTKRDRSESENENGMMETKRSKADSAEEEEPTANTSTHTEYEDAVSHLENKPDATFVFPSVKTPKEQQSMISRVMNETVVIEKPKTQQVVENNTNDLLTDDESIEEQEAASSKPKVKQVPNQVFSPYENSPVKKKVEAFEKFQKNENTATSSKMNTSRILKEIEENKGNVKEKAKGFIGNSSTNPCKINPSSASKIGKYIGQKSSMLNNSMSVSKSATPKSGHDFKERELRRLEKEKELKKKEMLKQAMTDERKRKYEEKVLRVQQQQKEALEREKEKALEQQRIKEERYKMVLQQKEEKQRLLKEENERKRLLAKQRAEEKKKEEEALRLAAQEKIESKRKIESESNSKPVDRAPIYMVQPTPPLPCLDCYDSDDERYTDRKQIPLWASKTQVRKQDYIQNAVGHKIKNTLFCCQSQNIDLRDVFQRIDPKKLKRTSSANWERPPRFTLLPSTMEEN